MNVKMKCLSVLYCIVHTYARFLLSWQLSLSYTFCNLILHILYYENFRKNQFYGMDCNKLQCGPISDGIQNTPFQVMKFSVTPSHQIGYLFMAIIPCKFRG